MDAFLTKILSGLGTGAAQGLASNFSKKHEKKEKRKLLAEQRRESLASFLDVLMDRQQEARAMDLNRSLRDDSRRANDMMMAASNARRALGG